VIDIGDKPLVSRAAVATGRIQLSPATVEQVRAGTVRKGDVLTVARVAAVQAVKRTPDAIPYCHPIPITAVDVGFDVGEDFIAVTCEVRTTYATGVEMEALCGVTAALLAVWDMVKYLEKDAGGQYPHTRIEDVRVRSKCKGNA